MTTKPAFPYKVVMVGNPGVGRRSLLRKTTRTPLEMMSTKIGVDIAKAEVSSIHGIVKMVIWNLATTPEISGLNVLKSRNLRAGLYGGADGAIFVFNIRDRQSFSDISKWMKEAHTNVGDVPAVLVGTHGDRPDLQVVSFIEAAKFAQELNMAYFQTSTEVGPDLTEPLQSLAHQFFVKLHKDPYDEEFG